MKIKSNVRAGAGGASGLGKNSKGSTEGEIQPVYVPPVYVAPVSRCAGI